jgi:N-acetylneuraminate synthase
VAHQATWDDDVFTVYERASLPWDWTPHLAAECDRAGVEFMSTPYDLEAIEHLNPYVQRWKVGSGDITYRAMLEAVARTGKPVILSTGASTMAEVVKAHSVLMACGATNVATLHCITDYTGAGSGNLRVLRTGMFDGISDHTRSLPAAVGAVALGARIIERHFTDDTQRPGPDHGFAMMPGQWRDMVSACNEMAGLLGNGQKKVEATEWEARLVQRRGWWGTPAGWQALRPCPLNALTPMDVPPADVTLGDYARTP